MLSYSQRLFIYSHLSAVLPKSSQNQVVTLASRFEIGGHVPGVEPKDVGVSLSNRL